MLSWQTSATSKVVELEGEPCDPTCWDCLGGAECCAVQQEWKHCWYRNADVCHSVWKGAVVWLPNLCMSTQYVSLSVYMLEVFWERIPPLPM